MNGQTRRYKKSLQNTPEPVLLSQFTKRMDVRGLMKYAESRGVKVADLSEKEKLSFVKK